MKLFCQYLLDGGIITQSQMREALEYQKKMESERPIGEVLVILNMVTIEDIIRILEKQLRERIGEN